MAILPKLVGDRIKRREDPALIQGYGKYVDDVPAVGMLHAAFFRSQYAHAKIRSLDVEAAKNHPGVSLVLTGEDILGKVWVLRKFLAEMNPIEAMEFLLDRVRKTKTEFRSRMKYSTTMCFCTVTDVQLTWYWPAFVAVRYVLGRELSPRFSTTTRVPTGFTTTL